MCYMLAMQGIQREYDELDTVWFMGGSLFKNYPYDIPTEAFSFEIFKQAFAAIQVGCTPPVIIIIVRGMLVVDLRFALHHKLLSCVS